MALQSNFDNDLRKEQLLAPLLDTCYSKNLKLYDFERISDLKKQMAGIDLIFHRKRDGETFYIDEKAQLDYINDDLPTFAFEICYLKKNTLKKGWFFDIMKKTQFYSLVTGIYQDEPQYFTSCKITLVNRQKLLDFLKSRNLSMKTVEDYVAKHPKRQGKLILNELDTKSEGYLYFSRNNKAEQPVNLILKLDFLLDQGLAKRLV
ncbi:hypothetical protein [Maribacter sp. 2210JD10-5]|uniref:hypothetical protein n=1 Tax=Maribacter sp. 2210JD10-5 TaxID=3386272 RepID=UPI0039BD883A